MRVACRQKYVVVVRGLWWQGEGSPPKTHRSSNPLGLCKPAEAFKLWSDNNDNPGKESAMASNTQTASQRASTHSELLQ